MYLVIINLSNILLFWKEMFLLNNYVFIRKNKNIRILLYRYMRLYNYKFFIMK